MANAARGEVEIILDDQPHAMRLTLGALAELEERVSSGGLVALAERFESGAFSSGDLIRLIGAGVRGAGATFSDEEIGGMQVQGGVVAAAKAGARLLHLTFAPLDDEAV